MHNSTTTTAWCKPPNFFHSHFYAADDHLSATEAGPSSQSTFSCQPGALSDEAHKHATTMPVDPLQLISSCTRVVEACMRLKDVGLENQIFSRLVARVRDDVDDAFRLMRKPNIARQLENDSDKQRRVNGVVLSVNNAIQHIIQFVDGYKFRDEKDGSIGVSNRWDWIVRNRSLLLTSQLELDTCHRSLLQVITAMQIWDMQLSEVTRESSTPDDAVPIPPRKRYRQRRRKSETDLANRHSEESDSQPEGSRYTAWRPPPTYYELEAAVISELSVDQEPPKRVERLPASPLMESTTHLQPPHNSEQSAESGRISPSNYDGVSDTAVIMDMYASTTGASPVDVVSSLGSPSQRQAGSQSDSVSLIHSERSFEEMVGSALDPTILSRLTLVSPLGWVDEREEASDSQSVVSAVTKSPEDEKAEQDEQNGYKQSMREQISQRKARMALFMDDDG